MKKFNLKNLEQGQIIHVRSSTLFGKMIRKAINVKADPVCWGNHDALVVLDKNEQYMIGESISPRATLTTLEHYEKLMYACNCQVKVFEVVDATKLDMRLVSNYWLTEVLGTWYDWMAFPRLFIKSVIIDILNWDCGWEWARWCTEGVAEAWREGAGRDVWGKKNPTPYTTEKRVRSGKLRDVTDKVLIDTNS